jgi:hypothetical protein
LVIRNGKKYTQKLKKSKKASPPSRAPRRPKQLALPPAACGDPLVELEAAARSLQPLVDALVAMTAKEQVSADVDARVGAVAELLHSMAVRLCASRSATADMAA